MREGWMWGNNWDQALTGALQSPSIDNSRKGTHGVLNSRMYSNLFGSLTDNWSKGAFDKGWKGIIKGVFTSEFTSKKRAFLLTASELAGVNKKKLLVYLISQKLKTVNFCK